LSGVNLRGMHEGLSTNDFAKLAEFKNAILQSGNDIVIDGSSKNVDKLMTKTKLFRDECNNDNVIVAFSDGQLGRLCQDRIVDITDVSEVDIVILAVPKVASRRNVVFCVDRRGKLIVVCLHTFITISEWNKVNIKAAFKN
jgi:hypothetical protein